ncbi:MAG: acyl carrier protein [Gammaproteobacteria bacterium]|nr:acyl carrier protein [Gammaproteobacteria bacterium]NDA14099.1 acyl carrier protein [Gammaproteobacteria bacterium]NDG43547.1 acyl carrier protein [Gammaproteobacteria bacterium]
MSDQSAVIEDIREFLGQFVSDPSVPVDQDLFGSGLVNSLFAMQLVLHIEAEYGIAVSNDDLDLDNFRSLQAIAGFVGRKRGD